MKELKCPKCGNVFSVDEADYATIVSQVRNMEFEEELHRRLEELKGRQEAEQKAKEAVTREDFGRKIQSKELEISRKDQEISQLKSQLKGFEDMKALELSNALAAKELVITGLKNDISRSRKRHCRYCNNGGRYSPNINQYCSCKESNKRLCPRW